MAERRESPVGEPFERTVAIANGILKPMAQLVKEKPPPEYQDYAHLYAAAVDGDAEHYLDIAAAMAAENRKVAMFEFGLVPQLFYAFECAPLCLEFFPSFYTRVDESAVYEFLDAAEDAGVPSDTCSTDRFIIGATLSGELPTNAFFVTSSSPCDGTRIAYPILQKILDCPMLFLDAPFRDDREAVRYYAGQLKDQLIPFVEERTGRKFDIDRFREVVVESNKAYELLVDTHETFRVKPAPHRGLLRFAPYTLFMQGAGRPETTETLELFQEDATRRAREGRTEGPFRELGATVVMTSLSGASVLEPVDTSSLDTMLEGVAWQGLDMAMSLMRFDTPTFIDLTLKTYDQFSCDCIIATQHVGCQSICGARGLLREVCRKRGIPLLFIEFDYNDDRVLSPASMRAQIEDFFATVME
jgi:benzoyl-CoA reductase/2-hydroxyglutaryl-CoA dehydratase subunit BcrC/BadD/HgdB